MPTERTAWLTTSELAQRLGVSPDKACLLCEEGAFEGAWRGGAGQHWRVPLPALEAFLMRTRTRVIRRPGPTL